MKKVLFAAAVAALMSPTLIVSVPVFGATDSTQLIQAHIRNVASGDAAITADYAPNAILWWVGGPLNGTYSGSAISGVWKKFGAAQGTLRPTVSSIVGASNPQGQTFVADVSYKNDKTTLQVRGVFLVRDGKLQDEIWQIAPQGPLPVTQQP